MLDYEKDVKQYAIDLLAGDLFGKGRVESAIFHTFEHVYEKGHEEGRILGLKQNDAKVEALERQVEALQTTLKASRTEINRLKWEIKDRDSED